MSKPLKELLDAVWIHLHNAEFELWGICKELPEATALQQTVTHALREAERLWRLEK